MTEPEDFQERHRWDWPYWTEADVVAALARAVDTLGRVRFPRFGAPSEPGACWPDVQRSYWEEHNAAMQAGRKIEVETRQAIANPREIDKMDDVLPWLFWLDCPRDRAVVFLRARGLSWRKISYRIGGVSHEWARGSWRRSITRITETLARNEKQARQAKA